MRSLRARLVVALGGAAIAAVLVTAGVSIGLLRSSAERTARDDLRRIARVVAGTPDSFGVAVDPRAGLALLRRVLQVNGDEIVVVTLRGTISDGSAVGTILAAVDVTGLTRGAEVAGTVAAAGTDYAYIGVPVQAGPGPLGDRVVGVVMARPVDSTADLVGSIAVRVGIAGVLATVLAVGLALVIAQRFARPVRAVSDAAAAIARGELGAQVPVVSDDEVGDLARSFNAMSIALAEARRREREFLASVSHELRTPITAIRGYGEALQDGALGGEDAEADALQIIVGETERLERMIDDVMNLARVGSDTFTLNVRDVDLSVVVRSAAELHRARATDAGLALEVAVADDMRIATDPDRLSQVIGNLLDNAVRVTPEGGRVRVAARAEDGACVIEVADTGPGIAAGDLPHVFERAYLWRASRGKHPVQTGLGLAIVRDLVVALGGSIRVESVLGDGSLFTIRFPAG